MVNGSTISENGFGGFLLENSTARIEQNNISNNGKWAIKAAQSPNPVGAANNWWGNKNFNPETMIIGPVEIQPILTKPLAIRMLE